MSKLILKAYNREIEVNELRQIARGYIQNINRQKFTIGGYPFNIWSNYIVPLISNKNYKTAIVVNDIGFEATGGLIDLGFTHIIELGTEGFVVNRLNILKNIVYKYDESITIDVCSIEEIKDLEKVDLIISNPPYIIGNEVTKNIIDNVEFEEFVNLMPLTAYRKNNLYNYIKTSSINVIDWVYDGAAVTTSSCLINKNKTNDLSYEEFMINSYDPELQEYYKLNLRSTTKYIYYPESSADILPQTELNNEYYFGITKRSAQNGVHKTENCVDYQFNILGDASGFIPYRDIDLKVSKKCTLRPGYFIRFQNKISCSNFKLFWYKNPLMHKLIKGLNKSSGSCLPAIPNIDWSIERDYEHLTLEDIMNILREENKEILD